MFVEAENKHYRKSLTTFLPPYCTEGYIGLVGEYAGEVGEYAGEAGW